MPQPTVLKGGLVAVTGGSRGLGAAITVSLLRRGFRVAALSRSGAQPEGIGADPAPQERLLVRACDVNDDGDLARCFAELDKEPGGLRALVNNAGVHTAGASAWFSTADFEAMLRTNTLAIFSASREAYPYLKKAGGVIMNIGSVFESLGAAQNACYSASKAAVGALTRSLASEWARDDIAILNVAPGYVATDMNTEYLAREDVKAYFTRQTLIGRPAQPGEVGELIAGLLDMDLMLLTGQTLRPDGGHSIAHGHIR
jgi:NAD(P)-dependent dehydrogenase (short-subunit alcohol dehydrogenase family)